MKPDRILAMIEIKQVDLGENNLFMSWNFSYEVETGTLKSWFTRGITVLEQDTTIAQQTPVNLVSTHVECYRFLELIGDYHRSGKLMDVQFREGQ